MWAIAHLWKKKHFTWVQTLTSKLKKQADQNKVCKDNEQKTPQEQKTHMNNGIGTEDYFNSVNAVTIANMLLKTSN